MLIFGMQPQYVRKTETQGEVHVERPQWAEGGRQYQLAIHEWASWKWVFQPHSGCCLWRRGELPRQSSVHISVLQAMRWLLLLQGTKFSFVLGFGCGWRITLEKELGQEFRDVHKNSWLTTAPILTGFQQRSVVLTDFQVPQSISAPCLLICGPVLRGHTPWDELCSWHSRGARGWANNMRSLETQVQKWPLLLLPTCHWPKLVTWQAQNQALRKSLGPYNQMNCRLTQQRWCTKRSEKLGPIVQSTTVSE